jgi:hypothetical protein
MKWAGKTRDWTLKFELLVMGGDAGRASHIGHHDCYTEICVRFYWWHCIERDNMTFQRMLIVYRLWESGLCACALARCIPHKCVSVLFWRELPLGPPWPNIPYRLCPRLWWLHVCKLFYLFNFFPEERRKNPLSGPKFRLDNTKGLWGLSCVSVSDFDQYNNPILSFFIYFIFLSTLCAWHVIGNSNFVAFWFVFITVQELLRAGKEFSEATTQCTY